MRFPKEITSREENFRVEGVSDNIGVVRRDPVEVEPIGTVILWPVRVVGFDQDCDGSLMPRMEVLDLDEIRGGLEDPDPVLAAPGGGRYASVVTNFGLYPSSGFVVTEEELRDMIADVERE